MHHRQSASNHSALLTKEGNANTFAVALAVAAVAVASKINVRSEDEIEIEASAMNNCVPSQQRRLQCCDCCLRVAVAISRSSEEEVYNPVNMPTTINTIITL